MFWVLGPSKHEILFRAGTREMALNMWHQNPNQRRAITRRVKGVQVAHQHRRVPHFAAAPASTSAPTMARDNLPFWLSLVWFVGLCAATCWMFFAL
jgi:hypothetical protein